jgi:hypothetical protein
MPSIEPAVLAEAPAVAEPSAAPAAPAYSPAATSPTFVPVTPVIIRSNQQKPVGPEELEAFEAPAVVRRQQADHSSKQAMPPVVQPTQSVRQAAAGADRPAFLRRIMD